MAAAIQIWKDEAQVGAINRIEVGDISMMADRVIVYGSELRPKDGFDIRWHNALTDDSRWYSVEVPDPAPIGYRIDVDIVIYQTVDFLLVNKNG